MGFCYNCGKEIKENEKFCSSCGAAVTVEKTTVEVETVDATVTEPVVTTIDKPVTQEVVAEMPVAQETVTPIPVVQETSAPMPIQQTIGVETKPKKKLNKKLIILISVITAVAITIAIILGVLSNSGSDSGDYKDDLEEAYELISTTAEEAESYCSLQSKVWRNCIMETDSYETDKYTKSSYGYFYDDFNTALYAFYSGESETRELIESNNEKIDEIMSDLKDAPEKYEEEYKAIREMYVAYSELADLVVGDSTYSWTTFDNALEDAKSNYKEAKSAAKVLIE